MTVKYESMSEVEEKDDERRSGVEREVKVCVCAIKAPTWGLESGT